MFRTTLLTPLRRTLPSKTLPTTITRTVANTPAPSSSSPNPDLSSKEPTQSQKDTTPQQSDPQQPKKKTQAQLDAELQEKMAAMSGDGGASGVEYEDGQPVAMKRSVKNNMFRYI